jgi:DNA-binding MarR family transcriptional regulator
MRKPSNATLAANALGHLRRVVHAIRSQSRALEARDQITSAQLWALKIVAEAKGGLLVGAIARTLAIHKANAGRLVDKLVARGHVRIKKGPGRKVLVTATPRGRALLARRAVVPAQVVLLERLERLPRARLVTIERSLATLVSFVGGDEELIVGS